MTPENVQDAKTYRTSDMYLAAYLMVAKVDFVEAEKDGNRSYFIFEEGPGHKALVAQFFNGKGMVAANEFSAKLRDIKTITHSG